MNVFDFDHTIYPGDSTVDFYRFCLKKQPGLAWYGLEQLFGFVFYGMGGIDKTRLKAYFFSFLRGVKDVPGRVEEFWAARSGAVAPWLEGVRAPGDLVISASPVFLLAPQCERLGLALIASDVDMRTGAFRGPNCYGEEKVRRFREKYPDGQIDRFYSDSYADEPLSRLAAQRFFVRDGRPGKWITQPPTP